ncbi:MAG TPA: radical SAM protein, partial [Stellaceae bacterium]|nr:radical SAM protein [Stellaceae bacterium]
MAYGGGSPLVALGDAELCAALDAIKALSRRFPVINPTAALDEVQRHIRGEEELFACVGGYKYFSLDWNLDIWRCEAWNEPLGSVCDLNAIAPRRDRCTACIMACCR